jgi:hypothetical protein
MTDCLRQLGRRRRKRRRRRRRTERKKIRHSEFLMN